MARKMKREVIEWVIILSVIGIIYFGGWHTEVIGRFQQVILSTGIISPSKTTDVLTASYHFILEDVNGEEVSFSAFEGKVIFLNFWATWCPPCIAEMPDIHDLYDLQGDRLAFVMVSLDQDEEKAKAFVKRKGFEFPIYFLRSDLPDVYDVDAIPTTYLIAKDGDIKIANQGMAKYNTADFRTLTEELLER